MAFLAGLVFVGCNSSKTVGEEDSEPSLGSNPVVTTFKTLYEYSPFIKPILGLGYAVYQNDGEFNTGLVMSVLNPEGTILKNQEYEISLLEQMRGTLLDIQNQLSSIGSQLDNVLLEIGLAKAQILTNINDPSLHVDNIGTVNESLYILASNNSPHEASEDDLAAQADFILEKSYVLGELNHIHSAITAPSAGKAPILSTFTDQLILGLGDSPTSNDLISAYKALEYYTMQLIGAEVQATNLLVDVSLYKDDNNSANYYYEKLNANLNDFFDIGESYSFTSNALRLILNYTDNYYDKPNESGAFFANRSEEVFERMAFLKGILLQDDDKSKVIIYRISENEDEDIELYAAPSPQTFPTSTLRCDKSALNTISSQNYDYWNESPSGEMQLNLANSYGIIEYTCNRIFEDYIDNIYIIDEALNVADTISLQKYNDGMEKDGDGEYTFGFGAIANRDSAGFEQLSWNECHNGNYLRDTFYDDNEHFLDNLNCFLDECDYNSFLKDPLNNGIFMKTKCEDISHQTLYDTDTLDNEDIQDCKVLDSQVYNMITMCSDTFRYAGEDNDFAIDTRLFRKYLADAKHSFATDGTITLGAGLFLEDVTSGAMKTIYEKSEKNVIQGEEYSYSEAKTFHEQVSLNKGHQYRLVAQMAAKIDQGTNATRGFVSMELKKQRKIRFIYPYE